MNKKKPKDYLLSNVPTNVIANPTPVRPDQSYVVKFNVAAWLKFLKPGSHEVKLVTVVKDQVRKTTTEVDLGVPSIGSLVMMSGVASVKVTGAIEEMHVTMRSEDNFLDFRVDELFVQRKQQAQKKSKNDVRMYANE